jgi:HAE1 family hydrophobic/amphiphilic exporter-1
LTGEDVDTLEALGGEVRRRLKDLPGVVGIKNDQEEGGGTEMRLRGEREALARYGIDARTVGQTVGFALRGTQLPYYHDDGKEVDVIARFRYEDREDVNRLLDFPMFSPALGESVPLRALVRPEVGPGLGTIRRNDRLTSYPLTLELQPEADMEVLQGAVSGAMDGINLPDGYSWSLFGRMMGDEMNDDARNLALLLSIVFVFLIMGVLFESFILPLSVLTCIPMAMFGVWWTLYLTGTPLDMMGGVGLVILIGVVVNNGIVLIDYVTRARAEGTERTQALVEGGGRRLRPILMTALTTVFGVLPMAVGDATFIGIPYAPLGRVVAGGMISGTVLTLYLVPFLYTVLDDMRASAARWLAWAIARPAATPAR